MATTSPKAILITGATGKQGGAVLKQLAGDTAFTVLAVTRNPESASAQKLRERYPTVILVQGDLDNVSSLFSSAKEALHAAHQHRTIHGVFSVQVFGEKEVAQGTALIDESIKQGVEHFVYSSVDRGGDEKSYDNPTPIPHFQSKQKVEHHLVEKAGAKGEKMNWTIVRPVAFMENLAPGFPTKVFLTALKNTMGDKPLQWVSVDDIGKLTATIFRDPQEFNTRMIGIAGDELDFEELSGCFERFTGQPAPTTFGLFGSALLWAMNEMNTMITWFKTDGYGVDIKKTKELVPDLTNFEQWLERSPFAQ